jgi:hypothetical protein
MQLIHDHRQRERLQQIGDGFANHRQEPGSKLSSADAKARQSSASWISAAGSMALEFRASWSHLGMQAGRLGPLIP